MHTPLTLRDTAWKQFACISAAVLLAHTATAATAATLTFDTIADYDNNFYEVANPNDLGTNTSPGGYLNKVNGTATSAIYNTHATGGSGGAGGTAGGTPIDTFGDFTIEATFSSSELAASGTGIGFFTKINGGAGYAALFRLTSTTTADFRLFEPAALSAIGASIGTGSFGGTFATNTYYIARLTVTDVGASVRFDASIWTTGGTQIGSTVTLSDNSSAVTGLGEVGIRAGSGASHNLKIDNFSVAAIPEPSTYVLFASGGALLAAALRRGKRTQLQF